MLRGAAAAALALLVCLRAAPSQGQAGPTQAEPPGILLTRQLMEARGLRVATPSDLRKRPPVPVPGRSGLPEPTSRRPTRCVSPSRASKRACTCPTSRR